MKSYQDHDPIHGNGKSVPKPKQPTPTTRGIVVNRYAPANRIRPVLTVIGAVPLTRKGNATQPWPR